MGVAVDLFVVRRHDETASIPPLSSTSTGKTHRRWCRYLRYRPLVWSESLPCDDAPLMRPIEFAPGVRIASTWVFAGAFLRVMIGTAQAIRLRRYGVSPSRWIAVSIVGGIVGWTSGMSAGRFVGSRFSILMPQSVRPGGDEPPPATGGCLERSDPCGLTRPAARARQPCCKRGARLSQCR